MAQNKCDTDASQAAAKFEEAKVVADEKANEAQKAKEAQNKCESEALTKVSEANTKTNQCNLEII